MKENKIGKQNKKYIKHNNKIYQQTKQNTKNIKLYCKTYSTKQQKKIIKIPTKNNSKNKKK